MPCPVGVRNSGYEHEEVTVGNFQICPAGCAIRAGSVLARPGGRNKGGRTIISDVIFWRYTHLRRLTPTLNVVSWQAGIGSTRSKVKLCVSRVNFLKNI